MYMHFKLQIFFSENLLWWESHSSVSSIGEKEWWSVVQVSSGNTTPVPLSEMRLYLLLRTHFYVLNWPLCSVTSPVISPASILSLTLFTVFVSLCKVEALSAVPAAYKWESEIRPFVCYSFIQFCFHTVECIKCPLGCQTVFYLVVIINYFRFGWADIFQ